MEFYGIQLIKLQTLKNCNDLREQKLSQMKTKLEVSATKYNAKISLMIFCQILLFSEHLILSRFFNFWSTLYSVSVIKQCVEPKISET